MIHVVATINLKPGVREQFLEIFNDNVINVLAERGCRSYVPAIDLDSGIAAQGPLRPDTVVVDEIWADLDCLQAHLAAPHMADYREKVKDMVLAVDLQVLQAV